MIFDEICLHNFGTYKGRQVIRLAPPSPGKPIVLIGGLNGGGKTTLLDAFQLVFYGKLAKCSNRGSIPYEEFLYRCINRSVDPSEGAALEIQFRHHAQGKEHTYRLHRSWKYNGVGTKETVEVIKDGKFDRALTETWNEHMEEFLPSNISHLFFFDGEKIEQFADQEKSAQLLSMAIHSLLGLDLVDRLSADLTSLEKRKRNQLKEHENTELQRKIKSLENDIDTLQSNKDEINIKRAVLQRDYDVLSKQLNGVEEKFRREGGELYARREILENEHLDQKRRLAALEDEMREIASGGSPLLLVKNMLKDISDQVEIEKSAFNASLVSEMLIERDNELLGKIHRMSLPKNIQEELIAYLKNDRKQRNTNETIECYLQISPQAHELLIALNASVLKTNMSQVTQIIDDYNSLSEQLLVTDRKISGIPSTDKIANLSSEIEEHKDKIKEITIRLNLHDQELAKLNNNITLLRNSLRSIMEKQIEGNYRQDGVSRIIHHSQKSRLTLLKFREAVVARHIYRLEQLIVDSFQQLLRKKSLLEGLKISPEDFSVHLYTNHGKTLLPERLSAGERQLLAIAMLWGLARASGRPLPTIIDTPLGRLDSAHRSNLIKRYFPNASHQVLLLSTDEEINQDYYDQIKPWIGHSYLLNFDDSKASTVVTCGYFW